MQGAGSRHRRGLHRSRENRVFFGVCGGIAEAADLNATGVRLIVVLLTLLSSIIPGLLIYLVFAMAMKPAPLVRFMDAEDEDLYQTLRHAPEVAFDRARRRFEQIDKRLQRLESIVTSRDYELEQEYRKL